jgi:hypothetical protein
MASKTEKPDTNGTNDKPRAAAYIVVDGAPQDGGNRVKAQWHRIGTAFPHEDGKGYNVELPPGVTVQGRIVIRQEEPRETNRPA